MVVHLVHVARATPLALENVPMGQLGPWLDPVTQSSLSRVALLVLAVVAISVVARNNTSAAITNKNGMCNLGRVGKSFRNSPTDDFPSLLEAENLFTRLILHALLYCSDSTPPHLSVDPPRVRLFWSHIHTHASALSSHRSVIHNRSRLRLHSVLWTLHGPIESPSEAYSPAGVAHWIGSHKPRVDDAEINAMDHRRTESRNSSQHVYDDVDALETFDGIYQQWSGLESIHPSQLSRVAFRHWVHCSCYYPAY